MKLTFLIHCSDTSGIIHEVTAFLSNLDGNIVYLDQHVDKAAAVFFMRLECEVDTTQNLDRLTELFHMLCRQSDRDMLKLLLEPLLISE